MALAFEMRQDVCVFVHPPGDDAAVAELDDLLERRDSGTLSQARYLRALEELVARHPHFVDGRAHLGNALYDRGSFEPALEACMHGFSLCMKILPPHFEVFIEWSHVENRPFPRAAYGIARCRFKLGRTWDGLSMLGRMLAWNPDDDQGARFIIGSEYLRVGEEEKARSFFETEASQ